jgi:hypothetical protein
MAILLDQANGQKTRILSHLLLHANQLIHIPLSPHKAASQEVRLWASKPHREVTRQFLCKVHLVSKTSKNSTDTISGNLTILPIQLRHLLRHVLLGQVRQDGARVVRVELDIALRVVVAKVRDELVRRRFGAAVRAAARHHELRGGRRDVDDALRAPRGGRGESHELAHDVEEAEHVDGVHLRHRCCRDVFGGLVAVVADVARGAGDEDVDLADGLQDFGDAREVGLRGDVGLDFGVGVRFLEASLCGGEDAFAALQDDDAGDAGFGEGLADCVADAGRWEDVSWNASILRWATLYRRQ